MNNALVIVSIATAQVDRLAVYPVVRRKEAA